MCIQGIVGKQPACVMLVKTIWKGKLGPDLAGGDGRGGMNANPGNKNLQAREAIGSF